MKLVYLIVILLAGGLLSWLTGRWSRVLPRIIALISLTTDLILLLLIYKNQAGTGTGIWMIQYKTEWIPSFGISLYLAADGLSMLLLMITYILGLLSVLISWKEIRDATGFFHFNILWILSGITGVFLSLDLFLFYFFWELML